MQTALIGDWEESLKKINNPIMTPEFVASQVAKAIFSGKSGKVDLPSHLAPIAGARGWPTWLHMIVNDTTKDVTIDQRASAKTRPAP